MYSDIFQYLKNVEFWGRFFPFVFRHLSARPDNTQHIQASYSTGIRHSADWTLQWPAHFGTAQKPISYTQWFAGRPYVPGIEPRLGTCLVCSLTSVPSPSSWKTFYFINKEFVIVCTYSMTCLMEVCDYFFLQKSRNICLLLIMRCDFFVCNFLFCLCFFIICMCFVLGPHQVNSWLWTQESFLAVFKGPSCQELNAGLAILNLPHARQEPCPL